MNKTKQTAYLILIGAVVFGLSIVVYVRHRSWDDNILATVGLLGGLAIIINSLPTNGNGKK